MLRLNNASRYTIASLAVQRMIRTSPNHKVSVKAHELSSFWQHQLVLHEKYVLEEGEDPAWCAEIPKLESGAA